MLLVTDTGWFHIERDGRRSFFQSFRQVIGRSKRHHHAKGHDAKALGITRFPKFGAINSKRQDQVFLEGLNPDNLFNVRFSRGLRIYYRATD